MARLARIVIPGLAHHVTQRGNRREQGYFRMTITAFISTN
jgi:putative transposase